MTERGSEILKAFTEKDSSAGVWESVQSCLAELAELEEYEIQ